MSGWPKIIVFDAIGMISYLPSPAHERGVSNAGLNRGKSRLSVYPYTFQPKVPALGTSQLTLNKMEKIIAVVLTLAFSFCILIWFLNRYIDICSQQVRYISANELANCLHK